ncbi:acyl carrier protein, partial [Streptomyces griseus]|uniref:acyl carrier protein n=1 Tax=Streptomyces griseus TaxID=1911 RepID=UPI0036A089E1
PTTIATPLNLTTISKNPTTHPLLRNLIPRRTLTTTVRQEDSRAFGASLVGLDEAEQQARVLDLVRSQVAAVLGHNDAGAIPPDIAFEQLGFDSLTAVELRNQLTRATGVQLSATLVFDHPTATALAGHLRDTLAPSGRKAARAKLDEVAALLSTLVVEADDHSLITEHIEDLLAQWRGTGDGPASPADDSDLNAASDEELFSLVESNRKA